MLSRRTLALWAALCAVLAVLQLLCGALSWTGDEPRYCYQALGVVLDHRFYPSPEHWSAFLSANHLQSPYLGVVEHPYQTLATAVTYGLPLAFGGLEAARWVSFLIASAGLLFLLAALRGAWLPVAIVAACEPFLAYMRLIYVESLLFCAVALALYAIRSQRRLLATACAVSLPFLHVRAWPIAAGIFVVLLLEARYRGTSRRSLVMMCAAFALGTGAFIAFQLATSGSIGGFAFPEWQPSASIFAQRVGMQLLGVRHGLLTYTPLALFAFAGLCVAAVRRERLGTYALVLLILYVGTFMWSEAGESYSGRFWVAALPFLAVGFDAFFASRPNKLVFVPFALFAAVQVTDVGFFIAHSSWYLLNRQTAIPHFILSQVLPLHLGLWLPVDAYPQGIPAYDQTIAMLLTWLVLLTGCIVMAALGGARIRWFGGVAAIALVLAGLRASFATHLPSADYQVTAHANAPIEIILKNGAHVAAIEFYDRTSLDWVEGAYPRELTVACYSNAGEIATTITPSRPLIAMRGCTNANRITIDGLPPGEGRTFLDRPGTIGVLLRPLG